MHNLKILLADNDPDFLSSCGDFLESEGYQVLKAPGLEEARLRFKDWVHLAILDLRLLHDDDEKDVSGLTLAKESPRVVPKIILTRFQTWEAVRESLGIVESDFPAAVYFVAKQEGLNILLRHIKRIFASHVRINQSLVIDQKKRDLFGLVTLIDPGLSSEQVLNRAEELEDLFRRLFYEKSHIRIDRLLWQRNGRVALIVFAFKESAKPEYFIVICGQCAIVNEEAYRFEEFAPKAPGDTGTMLSIQAETTHFAANAYNIVGKDLERSQTLGEQYRSNEDKLFKAALTTLFQHTLNEWHQGKLIQVKNSSLNELYLQRFRLSRELLLDADFEQRIEAIESQIATIGSTISHRDDQIVFQFSGQSLSFPNPISAFFSNPDRKGITLAIDVPGPLTGENILTDDLGRAWLTDFAEAGLAPVFWNYVAIESAIRFDWVETNHLLRRYEMERCLLNTDFAQPSMTGLEPIIGRPTRAITAIRKLCARLVGSDTQSYHLGIFFHAIHRLTSFDPALPLTSSELARLGHILLSMTMIMQKLNQSKSDEQAIPPAQVDQITILDEKARIIMIGNRKVRLAPQPFEVFRHLFLHTNEVCSKEELLKVALKGKYDESNLHTLIRRIRMIIEDDPEYPRYLITEPNAGYRLIPQPES